MPVRSQQLEGREGAARIWVFTCECGAPASFGEESNLLAALTTGEVELAGVWRCGWRNGRPVCVAQTDPSPALRAPSPSRGEGVPTENAMQQELQL